MRAAFENQQHCAAAGAAPPKHFEHTVDQAKKYTKAGRYTTGSLVNQVPHQEDQKRLKRRPQKSS